VPASTPTRRASNRSEIVTKTGVQVFSVEMATTEEEKTTGLMYARITRRKGMLFDFSPEQQVSMWMKNTYISLDMIFIRADGRILRIAENTEPLSTRIISSGGPAKGGFFWEVAAGTAAKIREFAPGGPRGASLVQRPVKRLSQPCWQGLKRVSTWFPKYSGIARAWYGGSFGYCRSLVRNPAAPTKTPLNAYPFSSCDF